MVPFEYHLVRTYFEADPDAPIPPLGRSMQFDDFQVVFDPERGEIRIGLSGQQVSYLKEWGWPSV